MVPTGIDKEKLLLQLGRLEGYIKELKGVGDEIQKKKDDLLILHAAERLLQIATEECLNIGNHIISGLGLERADTYREVFSRLKDNGILSESLGETMEELASFRNRLVHLYHIISKEEVISKLDEVDQLINFTKQINKYMEST